MARPPSSSHILPSSPISSRSRSRSKSAAAAAAAALLSLLVQCSALDLYSTHPNGGAGRRSRPYPRRRQPTFASSRLLSSTSQPGQYSGGGSTGSPSSSSSAPSLSSSPASIDSALSSISSQLTPVESTATSLSSSSTTILRSAPNGVSGSPGSSASPGASTTTTSSTALKQRNRALLNRRRPPLVDSDLLRFLGRQKLKMLSNHHHPTNEHPPPATPQYGEALRSLDGAEAATISAPKRETTADGYPASLTKATLLSCDDEEDSERRRLMRDTDSTGEPASSFPASTLSSFAQQDGAADASSTRAAPPLNDDDLGPYRSEHVAELLIVRDASLDAHLARKAGDRVQAEAVRRASRRQIRAFLRARDRQWSAANNNGQQEMKDSALPGGAAPQALSSSKSLWSRGAGQLQAAVELMMANNATHSYGLTARDVCEILIHTPSIALMQPSRSFMEPAEDDDASIGSDIIGSARTEGETLQDTLDRAMRLLTETLRLRRYDARKVLRSCPGLLTLRGSRNAAQMVAMLTKSLSVTANSLARGKSGLPVLLRRSPSALFRLVAFLASDAVRMPVAQIGPLIRQPKCQELLDAAVPVWSSSSSPQPDRQGSSCADASNTMQSLDLELDVGPGLDAEYDDEARVSAASPVTVLDETFESCAGSVVVNSCAPAGGSYTDRRIMVQERRDAVNALYRNMSRTAWTLRNELGTADLGRVIAAYPSVLLLDAESQVLAVAKFLMDDLGIWKDDLARVLQLYPVLLGMDVDKMRSVADYLSTDLEVSDDNLAVIFRSFPKLLTSSVEQDMKPVVDFLQDEIGIANVGRFISRLPPVLGYSVDRELRPKWKFLSRTFVDARFEVTRFPAYFSYPLERVIKARFEYLKRVKRIPTPLVSLDQVLRYGDRDFSTKVARDSDHGVAYSRFLEERQCRTSTPSSSKSRSPVAASSRTQKNPIQVAQRSR